MKKAKKKVSQKLELKIAKLPLKKQKKEGIFDKVVRFFREVKTEITKVKWPTRRELIGSTVAVIMLSLIFALFLGIVDFVIIKILKIIIK